MKRTATDCLDDQTLLSTIREKVQQGKYRISKHALQRQAMRGVEVQDILFVLKCGVHEKEKTGFDVKHQAWNYAIRGRTKDRDDLRVVVAVNDEIIVITVINLSGRKT